MIGIVFLVVLLFAGYQINIALKNNKNRQESPAVFQANETNEIAVIETNKGNIKLELYANDTPRTVENFVKLANESFYNGTKFHRVIPEFMIQGGDPLSKDDDPSNDGTGGPGYEFKDEMNPISLGLSEKTIKKYEQQGYEYDYDLNSYKVNVGSLAMANSGPNTNGSQFFIVTEKDQHHLNGKHTVFGRVLEGMDVVRNIEQGDVMERVYIE
ncbi:peptidylprolyl isomerase [Candidatus Parcubacteria bacterium]|nr:peptidylprolyl isomerase [Candidatus Parcubacteria bacterium]